MIQRAWPITLANRAVHVVRRLSAERLVRLVVAACAGLAALWHGRDAIAGGWREAKGYEFEWIAVPLSQGKGYTFDSSDSWLGPYREPSPTAWVEPVQTGIMALSFRLFGERGRMILVLLNYVWFVACCVVVFEVVRRIGNLAGAAVAAIGFAVLAPGKYDLQHYIGNSALATLLICAAALVMLSMFEHSSWRRSAGLGILLGLLVLTHAGTMLFVPFAALLAWLAAREKPASYRLVHGALVAVAAAAVVLPWAVRNYATFGVVVPVRTGLGLNMHYAGPALAQTIQPDVDLGAPTPPPSWTARSAREAVAAAFDLPKARKLWAQSVAVVRAGPLDNNEAERDAALREHSIAFVRDNPILAIRIGAAKAYAFLWGYWPGLRVVIVGAFVGVLLTIRKRGTWIIATLVALYIVPYLLSAPIFYRYRASVEPLFFVLGGLAAGYFFNALRSRFENMRGMALPSLFSVHR